MRFSSRQPVVVLSVLVIVLFAAWFWATRRSPRIGYEAYRYATALHAVCHRRDPSRLTLIDEMLKDAVDAKTVTTREADSLAAIIASARIGQWDVARTEARQLLEDQVQESSHGPTPP